MFAEWERQKGVVLIYPHIFCDFSDNLDDVRDCFDNLISEIAKHEFVYIIAHPQDSSIKTRLNDVFKDLGECAKNCNIFEIPSNDLWARDSIAISIKARKDAKESGILESILNHIVKEDSNAPKQNKFANFIFNGWGLKFAANFDNQINAALSKAGLLDSMKSYGFVLEGGSIDTNGEGVLLTTQKCLLEPNRNPHLSQNEIEQILKTSLNVNSVLWLKNGELKGDDTDSHIDTLARFIDSKTIAYVKCEDLENAHFSSLNAMENELKILANEHDFKLVALPFCEYVIDKSDLIESRIEQEDDEEFEKDSKYFKIAKYLNTHEIDSKDNKVCLPASYANFLFLNENTLLLPIYNKPSDFKAIEIMKNALPNHNIIPINCEALIRQHGSLHCVTMQIH